MRKTIYLTVISALLAGPVFAADKPAADEIVEFDDGRFDWSGLYAGFSVGYAYVEDDDPAFPIAPGVTIPLHSEGEDGTLGAFVGYSFQQDDWVFGAEYEYVDLDLQFVADAPINAPIPVFVEDAHILRARAGYVFNDSVQVYGFGGAARTQINIGLDDWTPAVGAGVDFALAENVVVGGQYTYSWFDGYDNTGIEGSLDYLSVRVGLRF